MTEATTDLAPNIETRRCEWCGDIAQGLCGCPAELEIARLRVAAAAAIVALTYQVVMGPPRLT